MSTKYRKHCVVSNCPNFNNKNDKTVHFFRSPKPLTNQRKRWDALVARTPFLALPFDEYSLCQLHFRPEDMVRLAGKNEMVLKIGAEPMPIEMADGRKRCIVPSCSNFFGTNDETIRFFAVPKKPEQRKKWNAFVTGKPDTPLPVEYQICEFHFQPYDIVRISTNFSLLKANTVPTITTVKQKVNVVPDPLYQVCDQKNTCICATCIQLDIKLQVANGKLNQLKEKIARYKIDNEMIKSRMDSTEKGETDVQLEKCQTCRQDLLEGMITLFVCRDQAFRVCKACLMYLEVHRGDLQNTKVQRRFFKCDLCTSCYPFKLLLDCHIAAHGKTLTSIPRLKRLQRKEQPKNVLPYTRIEQSKPKLEPPRIDEDIITIDDSDRESIASVDMSELPEGILQVVVSKEPAKLTSNYFKCGICGEDFELSKQLAEHMRSHTKKIQLYNGTEIPDDATYQCYICKKKQSSLETVRSHMAKHEKNHTCNICGIALTNEEWLVHLCGNLKTIRCEYCEKSFTTTLTLCTHMHDHDEKKMHRCTCKKFFPMTILRDIHEQSHPDTYMCEKCPKSFTSYALLMSHSKRHKEQTGDRPYLCDECGKNFASESSLKYHKMSSYHNKNRSYQCSHCPMKFVGPKNLRKHLHVHKSDTYVCEICGKKLLSMSSYTIHKKKHTRTEADRKFACQQCPMKFFDTQHLKKHQLVHTTGKNFTCDFCGLKYKYKGDLNKHLRIHMDGKIHECSMCPMRFEYPAELQKHLYDHYKEDKEKGIIE